MLLRRIIHDEREIPRQVVELQKCRCQVSGSVCGDLLASGTVSGETSDAMGCLLERTCRLRLPSGESRTFLEDGDEVIMRGYCEREGCVTIGFGECRGTVIPSRSK